MNDSIYENYMRSVLGYKPITEDSHDVNYNNLYINDMFAISDMQREDIEGCYPETYRIVYPMVQKACMNNTRPITRELIDSMTDEIYFAIEDKEMIENRHDDGKNKKSGTENRQISRNQGLNDLIRILLLRELLGRPGFPVGRPPLPRPPRPPYRPPIGPGPRPPRPGNFNRSMYEEFDDLYEY